MLIGSQYRLLFLMESVIRYSSYSIVHLPEIILSLNIRALMVH